MGWGAMVALGCTVGTLLSGIMAAAVSGWVFAIFCVLGMYTGWWVRKRFLQAGLSKHSRTLRAERCLGIKTNRKSRHGYFRFAAG